MKKLEDYRRGAIGALMDEYERAALELKSIVENADEADYVQIVDRETTDDDCRSMQTIMNHVVHSGYGYANGIRRQISMPHVPLGKERKQIPHADIGRELDEVLAYTIETLDGQWEMTQEEMDKIIIVTKGNFSENLEQLLEHAIVHILRHRRQIEKFFIKV